MAYNRTNKIKHRYQYEVSKEQNVVIERLKLKCDPKRRMLKRYMNTIKTLKEQALEESWNLNGARYSRVDIMSKIIEWVSDGNPLKMFCDQPGAPNMGTVYRWFKNYPEFEEDFRAAELAGGHSLGDRALMTAMLCTEPEEVPVAKLKYEAMSKRAAQMNQKFQDKQVFRAETDIKTLSETELMQKRQELLDKIKGELTVQGWKEPEVIESIDPIEPKNE